MIYIFLITTQNKQQISFLNFFSDFWNLVEKHSKFAGTRNQDVFSLSIQRRIQRKKFSFSERQIMRIFVIKKTEMKKKKSKRNN